MHLIHVFYTGEASGIDTPAPKSGKYAIVRHFNIDTLLFDGDGEPVVDTVHGSMKMIRYTNTIDNSIDGDTVYVVKNKKEFEMFVNTVKKKYI